MSNLNVLLYYRRSCHGKMHELEAEELNPSRDATSTLRRRVNPHTVVISTSLISFGILARSRYSLN